MASISRTVSQARIEPIHVPLLFIFLPRVDLIISAAILIAGLMLPLLVTVGVISATLWLGLLSFGLIAVGGTLFTIFIGEIR
jgi:hypothetical protein